MRFDLISIFPDYFAPLTLSLMGKAEDAGLLSVEAHDLRGWATGKHRSVDDTPYGGGAGMVMRADVWARALDEVLAIPLHTGDEDGTPASSRRILAIPTPSGTPLTQPLVEDLACADQIVVACGRYEGIDARVAQHYRGAGVEVLEFSIGDYVLNGGEVAAMVLTEAVARLLDGFMGNPDSLVEESHSGAGLLEYPVFTKPREFRSLEIPEVLLGGNHATIERWRRDRAIEKTAAVRPDIALSLRADSLGREDRAALAACGVAYPREGAARPVDIRSAKAGDAHALSALAARTFPEACPPDLPREAINAFIATELNPDMFEAVASQPERYRILVADVDGALVGYTLTVVGEGAIPDECVRPERLKPTLRTCPSATSTRHGGVVASPIRSSSVRSLMRRSAGTHPWLWAPTAPTSTRRPSTNVMDSVVVPPAPSMLAASLITTSSWCVISRGLTAGNSSKRA